MFEKETIFDGSLKPREEEKFIELDEEDDVDISKFKETFLKNTGSKLKPVEEWPVLHSYSENSGMILNVKRKNPDNTAFQAKRVKE